MPSEDFAPHYIEIQPGDTVIWQNTGGQGHDVTSFDGLFASPVLANGDSFSFTFTTPGTYGYYCAIHPSTMVATVVVSAASDPSVTSVPEPTPAATQPVATAPLSPATPIPPASPASTPVTPAPVVEESPPPASPATAAPWLTPAPTPSAAFASPPPAATPQSGLTQAAAAEDTRARGTSVLRGALLLAALPIVIGAVLLLRRLR